MDDGEISISAYDTAWVGLVEDINGSGVPQFPSTLQWIANNQLPDNHPSMTFSAYDRIISTLACVVALKKWKIHPQQSEKGLSFLKENICKLEVEKAKHMPIGFEVAFPSLIDIARNFGIRVPDDSPVFREIYARRNLKLTRIPKEILHAVPTTLLYSLEGMPNLEWEKLLRLQCLDGSFLFSPASTATALMETKDDKCLRYISKAVEKFNGGAVDRLQRLGISRYFRQKLENKSKNFSGEFCWYIGQSNQAVSGMFNLFRASQLLFPGKKILEDAKNFSSQFLREKQANDELIDKWIITKDLPGEVHRIVAVFF
ncbi:unnamed protein product [Ilex paraguariensis]|uniref:Uncharacterized protein n=1 Tax=Ilex paraguariensis TaxID=185542 RepID=A0ABC8S4C8_9AQUA